MADLNNPYAPPTATVADAVPSSSADFQPIKIFGTKGRIGRLRYVAYMFGANLILGLAILTVVFVLSIVLGLSVAASGGAAREEILALAKVVGVVLWVVFGIGAALNLVFHIMIGIQRSHDMNLSGWAVLLTLIPFVMLYWMFAPGTKGSNRFGLPPPPNSAGVKVFFGISIFFMVVAFLISSSIVAAIALPAYADYVKRIQANQSQQLRR